MSRPFRGEVFDLELAATPGLDDWGSRPAVVVSNDFFNQRLDTVVLIALTSTDRNQEAGCVRVPRSAVAGPPGIDGDSTAVCHSLLTEPQADLGRKRGVVTDQSVMVAISEAAPFALDLAPALD